MVKDHKRLIKHLGSWLKAQTDHHNKAGLYIPEERSLKSDLLEAVMKEYGVSCVIEHEPVEAEAVKKSLEMNRLIVSTFSKTDHDTKKTVSRLTMAKTDLAPLCSLFDSEIEELMVLMGLKTEAVKDEKIEAYERVSRTVETLYQTKEPHAAKHLYTMLKNAGLKDEDFLNTLKEIGSNNSGRPTKNYVELDLRSEGQGMVE